MKAFMSERSDYQGPVFGSWRAPALIAEAEARAILAATEPCLRRSFAESWHDGGTTFAPVWAIKRQAEGRALAESLAAFIALEIS